MLTVLAFPGGLCVYHTDQLKVVGVPVDVLWRMSERLLYYLVGGDISLAEIREISPRYVPFF